VLIMEDLQAADDASLLLLEFLVKDVHGARLLVVGTYRNLTADRVHGIGDAMGQLVREGHLLRLGGLDRREVRELIEAISGSVPSEATAAAVHEATEGNPLFVRETVRLLATDVTLAASACRCPGASGRRSGGGWPRCPPTPCWCCRRPPWSAAPSTCRWSGPPASCRSSVSWPGCRRRPPWTW
jgi:hypothetical protein